MSLSNKNTNFLEGDLIAVVGGAIGKDADRSRTAIIARVSVVGLEDLFVETVNGYPQSSYKVSKSMCQKITVDPKDLDVCSKTLAPKIGDLVMSYKKPSYSGAEITQITGVLYKVHYHMGRKDICTIMIGTDFHDVKFNSLIVLQKATGP